MSCDGKDKMHFGSGMTGYATELLSQATLRCSHGFDLRSHLVLFLEVKSLPKMLPNEAVFMFSSG